MTAHKSYNCDLCKESICLPPDPTKAQPVGIYWRASSIIELTPVKQAEHHICGNCVKALREVFNKPAEEPL